MIIYAVFLLWPRTTKVHSSCVPFLAEDLKSTYDQLTYCVPFLAEDHKSTCLSLPFLWPRVKRLPRDLLSKSLDLQGTLSKKSGSHFSVFFKILMRKSRVGLATRDEPMIYP